MPAVVPFRTMPELFDRLGDRYNGQGRAALGYKSRETQEWTDISWEALREDVRAFAAYLHGQGVRPGDRVAVLSENRPEWAVTDLATQALGAVNVALYATLPPDQAAYIVRDSGSKVLVVSAGIQLRKAQAIFADCPELERVVTMTPPKGEAPDWLALWTDALAAGRTAYARHREAIDALGAAVTEDDVSALIYTSGTTGHPKGVMLTHRNVASNAKAALEVVPFEEGDVHLSFLPLSHSFERTGGYVAIMAGGGRIVYAESVDAVSKNLGEVRPTVLVSVPRVFERVYNVVMKSVEDEGGAKKKIFDWAVATGKAVARRRAEGRAPGLALRARYALATRLVFGKLHEKLGGRLRFAVSGGAALPQAIGEFFQAAGVTIIEGYGLTETAPVLSVNPLDAPRYGTVGHVMPGVTVGIRDLTTGAVLAELRGEDYPSRLTSAAGEIVARGPNVMKGYWRNDAATAEALGADGWYHTGDVGRFEDGYLRITDRIKHMIVSKGGKNVYPGPIEEAFKTNPYIDQVMVVGEGREFLTALVVPDAEALGAWAGERGLATEPPEALLAHPDVQALFAEAFRAYSKGAAPHEKIRAFRLVPEPFSVENGLMTPTLKLRRRQIERAHAALVEDLYAGAG